MLIKNLQCSIESERTHLKTCKSIGRKNEATASETREDDGETPNHEAAGSFLGKGYLYLIICINIETGCVVRWRLPICLKIISVHILHRVWLQHKAALSHRSSWYWQWILISSGRNSCSVVKMCIFTFNHFDCHLNEHGRIASLVCPLLLWMISDHRISNSIVRKVLL